jgi:hypothetical protein
LNSTLTVLLCGCSNDGGNATRRDDMTTTTTSTDAARITDFVAHTLGWLDYETTKSLDPFEHSGQWYLSVRDGLFCYVVRLGDADTWQDDYTACERPYDDFCGSIDVVDPRTVADIFADLDELTGFGGIDGDATMSVGHWLGSLDAEDCERIGDVMKAPGIEAFRAADGEDWYGELEDAQSDVEKRYNCVSDRYDQCPTDTYTLDEFQAMCLELFGEEADLRADGDNYRDETGAIVLEEAGA